MQPFHPIRGSISPLALDDCGPCIFKCAGTGQAVLDRDGSNRPVQLFPIKQDNINSTFYALFLFKNVLQSSSPIRNQWFIVFLARSPGILSITETFLFFLTSYCVVFRSPKSMQTFKWLLMNQQSWMLVFQIFVCDLAKPVVFFPIFGFVAMGLLAAVIVSTTALFEYRHHATLSSNSRLNFSTRTRVLIFVIRFFAGCSAAIALQVVSDELEQGKKYWMENGPCQLDKSETDEMSSFFLSIKGIVTGSILMALCGAIPISEMIFYGVDSYRRVRSPRSTISNHTRQLQLNFLRALLIQECAPLLLAYPEAALYIVFSSVTWVMSIDFNNILMIFFLSHGLFTSLAILSVNRPYREFLLQIFALQVCICDLMRPILYIPVLGYVSYGLLNEVFTPFAQLQIAMALLAAVIVSTTALLEYRHHATLPNDSRLKFSTRTRVLIFIVRFSVGCSVAIVLQGLSEDHIRGRQFWIENAPCRLEKSATDISTSFFFSIEGIYTALLLVSLCAVLPVTEMFFYGVDSYRRIKSPNSTISYQTRQLQLKFLRSLLIQECAPLLIAYPEAVLYIVFSSLTWVMSIDLNNVAILLLLSHGIFTSLAILFVNRPYRDFLFQMFLLQIYICDLVKPIIFVPVLGFGLYGVLNDYFTPFTQFQIALSLAAAVIVSTTALFEYRHHATLPSTSRINFRPPEMLFYGIDSYRRIRSPTSTISNQTRRKQLNFLRALLIQECVPMFIAYPEAVFYVLFSCLTWFMSIDLTNFSIILILTHGLFASIAIIFVNRPYRDFVLQIANCRRRRNSITSRNFKL
ncbi:unnamed protein product [Caenorhabditis auriculariae]|uniref:G protein-coupled receptor n=1 Tax=Caenorhabditis auriculariae TaxID=2777116 RepID=A0A8S1HSG1_9PELO|nr:unnamed protein product [Caenorhabditis auriculariae]